ncbi:MAG: iron(III) transport system substrate-binding protein, partial [Myxococcota bacterium]
ADKPAADKPAADKPAADKPAADKPAAAVTLRVASGRKESLVGPLFTAFTAKTGIKVEVDYNKTPALAMQLITEGKDSPADVFYAQESGYLGAMAKAGLLAEVPADILAQVRPELEGGQKHWLAVSGRARVLVYDPAKVTAADLPKSLKDLTGERWKGKLGWAPTNGSFQAHISALRHQWGEAETETWLRAIAANDVRSGKNNSALVKDVARGAIEAGLVNHYYSHKLKLTDKVKIHSFAANNGSNVVMISGIGVLGHSQKKDAVAKLLAFLISEDAQKLLSQDNFEYPARKGMRVHADVAPLSELKMTPVKQEHLTDAGPTLKLLQKVGLN